MNLHRLAFLFASIAVAILSGCGDSDHELALAGRNQEGTSSDKGVVTLAPAPGRSILSSALVLRSIDLPEDFFESETAGDGNAVEILTRDGIRFSEGATARFNRSENTLEVKATEDDLMMVEAVVDSWKLVERHAREERVNPLYEKLRSVQRD